jgi:hypothetical protein
MRAPAALDLDSGRAHSRRKRDAYRFTFRE